VFGVDAPMSSAWAPGDGEILADEWLACDDEGEDEERRSARFLWGDAEILIVVTPRRRGTGIATFMDQLEDEADSEA